MSISGDIGEGTKGVPPNVVFNVEGRDAAKCPATHWGDTPPPPPHRNIRPKLPRVLRLGHAALS